ncbi:NUDIX domain-containing protein [archaeon]|nr:NUDIX domain-containing protein [archaeon]MBL7057303.1 NUDIX domain-containing protein [Candidatus Woesearchaeota archaeon]
MKEMLDYYSKEGEHLGSMEKSEMHQKMKTEYLKKGKVSVRHKDVKLILMTSQGRIILQRRSKWKGMNSGLWDKTIGGHIRKGDQTDLAMLKECSEELGIPATIVPESEFENAVSTTNLQILGILKKLVYLDNFQSKRTDPDGNSWIEPAMTQFYIGYYDGPIRFVDSESSGIEVFSLDELNTEIKNAPDNYTEDIKVMLHRFKDYLKPATTYTPHVLND